MISSLISITIQDAPIVLSGNEFILRSSTSGGSHKRGQNHQSSRTPLSNDPFTIRNDTRGRDEDIRTESSRTDADPTDPILLALLEDDDDHIVWDPRYIFSLSNIPTYVLFAKLGIYRASAAAPAPLVIPPVWPSSPSHVSPITPMKPTLSPIGSSARSPTTQKPSPFASPRAAPSSTTAQDLLNNVMNMGLPRLPGVGIPASGTVDPYRSHVAESSAPQPQLLFGSGPPNQPDHSIWSTTLDGQSIKFPGASTSMGASAHIGGGGAGSGYSYQSVQQQQQQQQHQQIFPRTGFAHSIWSSVYPNNSTSTSSAHPSSPYTLPLHSPTGSSITDSTSLTTHQRTLSSSSASLAHLFTTQHQKRSSDDPLLYSRMDGLQPGMTTAWRQDMQTVEQRYPNGMMAFR